MNLLLDTNAFIWALSDVSMLGKRTRQDIANPSNKVSVSDIAILECAIKQRTGKLILDISFDAIDQALIVANIQQISFNAWAAQKFVNLPHMKWADPFDLALIALALAKHLTIVTSDSNMLTVAIPELRVIDTRK